MAAEIFVGGTCPMQFWAVCVLAGQVWPQDSNGRVWSPTFPHGSPAAFLPWARPITGNLLTSSNYDDGQKKVTGGRNGYGAKLCNIFSTKFVVETCDM